VCICTINGKFVCRNSMFSKLEFIGVLFIVLKFKPSF